MAREAVKVELYGMNNAGCQRRFNCASGTTIPKGTILKMTDNRTAIASTGTGDIVAGIASMEKSDTDSSTTISVWTDGLFLLYASGSITAGDKVVTAAPGNYVKAVTNEAIASYGKVLGIAQENATAGNQVEVRVLI